MIILGIETSCDETAASLIKFNKRSSHLLVLSNIVSSQINIHKKYGGVIPEIAARAHVGQIIPVIHNALKKAKINYKKIDYIAVTKGPGLITSLLSGVETARVLAFAWHKPIIEVNHIEGHIYANFIDSYKKIKFPAIILTVSGGHTNLILMTGNHKLKIIGETLDDAAGEAYDKAAKMMNLGYPGGPIISKQAEIYANSLKNGLDKSEIDLPRPMLNDKSFNFSFSGLKTALLYKLQKDKNWQKKIPEYCYKFQEAVNDVLIKKTIKAAQKYKVKSVMLSGGVSANYDLRSKMEASVKENLKNTPFFTPDLKYTTDNAAMIAAAGVFGALARKTKKFSQIKADPNWNIY
jgi:N6-L-threonylcarbamoyladenine synthase